MSPLSGKPLPERSPPSGGKLTPSLFQAQVPPPTPQPPTPHSPAPNPHPDFWPRPSPKLRAPAGPGPGIHPDVNLFAGGTHFPFHFPLSILPHGGGGGGPTTRHTQFLLCLAGACWLSDLFDTPWAGLFFSLQSPPSRTPVTSISKL